MWCELQLARIFISASVVGRASARAEIHLRSDLYALDSTVRSQLHCILQHSVPETIPEPSRRNHIDFRRQQLSQISAQPLDVEQASSRVEVHKEIHVAAGIVLPTRDRPKYADITCAPPFRKTKNLSPLRPTKFLQRDHILIVPRYFPRRNSRRLLPFASSYKPSARHTTSPDLFNSNP